MGRRRFGIIALALFLPVGLSFSPALSQEKTEYGKVLGTWNLEVYAGGEYYYLTLNLQEGEGKLSGSISESSGAFTDTPLSNLELAADTLKFEFEAPTPPDGLSRLIKAELQVIEDKLEGVLDIPDLGMTVSCTATRQK